MIDSAFLTEIRNESLRLVARCIRGFGFEELSLGAFEVARAKMRRLPRRVEVIGEIERFLRARTGRNAMVLARSPPCPRTEARPGRRRPGSRRASWLRPAVAAGRLVGLGVHHLEPLRARPGLGPADHRSRRSSARSGRPAASGSTSRFPETYIAAYPYWRGAVSVRQSTELCAAMQRQAVRIPSEDTEALCQAAARAGVHCAVGLNELSDQPGSLTLFKTLLFIGRDGSIVGLICYEHRMTLQRAALALLGEELHAVVWPGWWNHGAPPRGPAGPARRTGVRHRAGHPRGRTSCAC